MNTGNVKDVPLSPDYALVEVIEKSKVGEARADEEIKRGLFRGLKVKVEDDDSTKRFLVLQDAKTATLILDLDEYNIVMCEYARGEIRDYVFFRSHAEDQTHAFNEVAELLASYQTDNKVTDDVEVIDTTLFKNIPFSLQDANKKNASENKARLVKAGPGLTGTTAAGVNNRHSNTAGSSVGTAGTHRGSYYDRQCTFQVRKTRKPHPNSLRKLRRCLSEIATGDYKAPKFPVTKEDGEAGEADSNFADTHHDEMHGGWEGNSFAGMYD